VLVALHNKGKKMLNGQKKTNNAQYKHKVAWRWHFYAGLYVIPFMLILSLSGLVMLYDDVIENAFHHNILNVEPLGDNVTLSAQLDSVKRAYPTVTVTQFVTPENSHRASRFAVSTVTGQGLFITVNPYTGNVLGEIDRDNNINNMANDIHGTLLMGDLGDRLIEIAASLLIILIVSGIYLWWPTDRASKAGMFKVRLKRGRAIIWRDLHANIGLLTSAILLLFVLSGLSWSGVWGAKFVQAWNSFPAEKWDNVPLSDETHAAMNHDVLEEVPWNLAQTQLPLSGSQQGSQAIEAGNVTLESVYLYGLQAGFTRFKINLPSDKDAVFSITANTMSGDINDARDDRTMHIDQYSGKVLADIGWADYNLMAKSMAAGIALHQGDMGLWNRILNTLFCLAFMFIAVSGAVMWWSRRAVNTKLLAAPPKPTQSSRWLSATILTTALALMFPMAAVAILCIWLVDFVIISRVKPLSYHLK